jgi:RNAse (barnase) inhibitor barstar
MIPAFQENHFFIARLDRRNITNKEELFDGVAESCGFPDYFGHNWAALKDCLLDFSWLERKPLGFILLYRYPELLNWTDMSEFIIVVDRVRMIYAQHNKPFKILMASRAK